MADEEQQGRGTDERGDDQKTEQPSTKRETFWQGEEKRSTGEQEREDTKQDPSTAPASKQPEEKKEEPRREETRKEETRKEETRKEEPKKEEEPPRKTEQKKEQPKPKPEPKKEEPRKEEARKGDAKSSKQSETDHEEASGTETSEGRLRQREFFKQELRRLQEGLKRESSKIVPPHRRKYTPFVFNTLEPYYNTHTTRFLVEMPDDVEPFFTFSSRNTAQGLTDPWIDLRMDQEILPMISSRPNTRSDPKQRRKKTGKSGSSASVNRKEGSTRLPKFPVVNLETKELATKQLYYSDVPMLRKELKTKYSSQARTKVDADYNRTKQDFYRMELDKLDQVAPTNRRHLTSTYMAYLQNTPGSRRAVTDCVRSLEGKAN